MLSLLFFSRDITEWELHSTEFVLLEKSDSQVFSFKIREITEEMARMEVCKTKAQMEEGAWNGLGARAEHLEAHADVTRIEHSSSK